MKAEDWKQVEGILSLADLEAEKPTEVAVGDRKICLLRRDEKLFAFSDKCPHASVPLCKGFTDARGHLVCPKHGFRFELSRGYNSSGEGYKLKTFPVEIRTEGIFVALS